MDYKILSRRLVPYYIGFVFCYFTNMNSYAQFDFRLKSTNQCLEYLKESGVSELDMDTTLSLESESGLLYSLPNGTVVLIPSDFRENYEGIIFANREEFNKVKKTNFFPISDKYLSFWEKERERLSDLPNNIIYYAEIVKKGLELREIHMDRTSLNDIYQRLINYLIDKKRSALEKDIMVLAVSIIIMNHFVDNKEASWKFIKRYEVYNSYSYPIIIKDEEIFDVYSSLSSTLEIQGGNFQLFLDFIGYKK